MIDVSIFDTRASLMEMIANIIAESLKTGIELRGEGFAALSGGSTPIPAYEALSTMPLDWARVTFLLVDERFVSPTDPASNEGMLRRALAPALAAGARLLPMYAEGATLSEAADRADALYADKPIDIALLGMGADGHVASWFIQSPEIASALDLNNQRSVIAVTAPGAAGSPQRLTLTLSAIARAHLPVLLITGYEKRRILDEEASLLPVGALRYLRSRTVALWAP